MQRAPKSSNALLISALWITVLAAINNEPTMLIVAGYSIVLAVGIVIYDQSDRVKA